MFPGSETRHGPPPGKNLFQILLGQEMARERESNIAITLPASGERPHRQSASNCGCESSGLAAGMRLNSPDAGQFLAEKQIGGSRRTHRSSVPRSATRSHERKLDRFCPHGLAVMRYCRRGRLPELSSNQTSGLFVRVRVISAAHGLVAASRYSTAQVEPDRPWKRNPL